MGQSADFSAYPLNATLTQRVVNYLCYFRLFISLALTFAFLSGALVQGVTFESQTLPLTTLSAYFVLAAYLFIAQRRENANFFYLAQTSLFIDIGFLTLLFYIFGGLDSGLAVLLVFICVSAAIVLPLRLALLLASIATLAVIGESVMGGLLRSGEVENLLRSGLFGVTNFLTAILAHLMANWVRDYRLIAERQERTLTRLEQINELIIRRMRSGVLAVDRDGEIRLMNESAWFIH